MIHTLSLFHARELVGAVPNAKVRLWNADLDCYVRVTKAELDRIHAGANSTDVWEVDIHDVWEKTVVYLSPVGEVAQ